MIDQPNMRVKNVLAFIPLVPALCANLKLFVSLFASIGIPQPLSAYNASLNCGTYCFSMVFITHTTLCRAV